MGHDISDLSAVVVLCDQIYVDRGKISVLGGMWSKVTPGDSRMVRAVMFLNIAKPTSPVAIELSCQLRNLQTHEVIASSSLDLEIAPPDEQDDEGIDLDFRPSAVPIEWEIPLAPQAAYTVEVLREDVVIAASPFETRPGND